jgi:predicted nucleic acid-binding Zn ribbon protein
MTLEKSYQTKGDDWRLHPGSARLPRTPNMAQKNPQLERVGAVLDQSLKRLALAPRLDEYSVWPIWNEIVGNTIARNAQPEKIRNGTLFIKVSSPVWMQQLQFMKNMIADKLNQRLKQDIVKNIFFMVGRIDAAEAEALAQDGANQATETAEREVNEEFLTSIDDAEIRDAFKKLLKSFARRKPRA